MVRFWVVESLASFRAAHSSLADAIAACERPDWLIALAWDALPDHKDAVRFGARAAALVVPDHEFIRMFWPFPSQLEVIAAYTGDLDSDTRGFDRVRSYTIATPLGGLVAYGVARVVHLDQYSVRIYSIWYLLFMAVFAAGLSLLVKRAIGAIRARHAARLDDKAAFAVVERALARGLVRHRYMIPGIMKTVGQHIQQVVARELR